MKLTSTITARWVCPSAADAIAVETHVLDWANSGLIELTVTHMADEQTQGDADSE